jgi:hypothetical protein
VLTVTPANPALREAVALGLPVSPVVLTLTSTVADAVTPIEFEVLLLADTDTVPSFNVLPSAVALTETPPNCP